MNESNSSTDCGNIGAKALAGSGVALGAGGRGPVGAGVGACPFVLGASTVADAMSSSLEVAASSL
jgi:hypothetical protein